MKSHWIGDEDNRLHDRISLMDSEHQILNPLGVDFGRFFSFDLLQLFTATQRNVIFFNSETILDKLSFGEKSWLKLKIKKSIET